MAHTHNQTHAKTIERAVKAHSVSHAKGEESERERERESDFPHTLSSPHTERERERKTVIFEKGRQLSPYDSQTERRRCE
jgi:hypothetical protein